MDIVFANRVIRGLTLPVLLFTSSLLRPEGYALSKTPRFHFSRISPSFSTFYGGSSRATYGLLVVVGKGIASGTLYGMEKAWVVSQINRSIMQTLKFAQSRESHREVQRARLSSIKLCKLSTGRKTVKMSVGDARLKRIQDCKEDGAKATSVYVIRFERNAGAFNRARTIFSLDDYSLYLLICRLINYRG